jgi:cyclopropane fatty-acyl-phospholipid synthase-like methyltransferase
MKDFFPRFYSFCVSENNYILKQLSSHHSPLKKAHKKHDINKHTTSSSLSPLSLSLERATTTTKEQEWEQQSKEYIPTLNHQRKILQFLTKKSTRG